ncbi:hypothetical protein [Streptomyces hirsutus]|uniref:hypothetical protein n=1 Tax=Streptomyces hirsutus TaxID=35620 RepID=UPI0036ABEC90
MSGGSAWIGVAVAAVATGYALFSRRLASTPVSAPFFADLYGNWYDAAKAVTLDLREAQGTPEDVGEPHDGSRRLR